MQIHYINLDRRPDRNAQFVSLNRAAGELVRFSAISYDQMRIDELVRNAVIAPELNTFSKGALGNALSHRALWERAVASGKALTIAEDDAVFHERFSQMSETLMQRLPADWEMVFWGWNHDSVLHADLIEGVQEMVILCDKQNMAKKVEAFRDRSYEPALLRLRHLFGTAAYSISAKAAEKLLHLCFPLKNEKVWIPGLQRHVDSIGLDVVLNKYFASTASYVCFPPLAMMENDHGTSDVQKPI